MHKTDEHFVDRAIELLKTNGEGDVFRPPFFCHSPDLVYLSTNANQLKIRKDAITFLHRKKIKNFSNIIKFPVPKNAYAYRKASMIDIDDHVKFLSLVLMAAGYIEKNRIPKNKNIIFSYRFLEKGPIFSEKYNFKKFKRESSRLSKMKKHKVKIATDISNFYDRLNLHRLESALASAAVPPDIVKSLNNLLLFWADRNSYGLPVGCDASRILAEAALISVDRALISKGVRFIRFVDDYRIFASNFAQAHSYLHTLIEELDKEGLFLNTSKTVFFDISESDREDDQKDNIEKFEKIDQDERIEESKRVKVGYVSKIVKHYRYPGQEKIKEFQKADIEIIAKKAEKSTFEHAEEHITYFVKCFIYQGGKRHDLLNKIISRYIHSLSYIVDALIEEHDKIDPQEKILIAEMFKDFYRKHQISPYYRLMILRLFSCESYLSIQFLNEFLDNIKIHDNEIILREFCLRIQNIDDRSLIHRVRDIYQKSPTTVRRAFFHTYERSTAILEGEKRAWMRNVQMSDVDPHLKSLSGQYLEP
ncbi:RNA-directed DNA polymerase [Amorphus sp. 3PC139-8]|uniref:RNA-directed DNA polymerase n=1 Tax=Amorphus sp. 3PC139-8 TaxID=2735676 RepID=UPI00345C97BE